MILPYLTDLAQNSAAKAFFWQNRDIWAKSGKSRTRGNGGGHEREQTCLKVEKEKLHRKWQGAGIVFPKARETITK